MMIESGTPIPRPRRREHQPAPVCIARGKFPPASGAELPPSPREPAVHAAVLANLLAISARHFGLELPATSKHASGRGAAPGKPMDNG